MIKIAATSKLALYDIIVEEQPSTEGGDDGQMDLFLRKGDFKAIVKMLEDHEIVGGLLISEPNGLGQMQNPLANITYLPSIVKPNGTVVPESIEFSFYFTNGETVDITLSVDNTLSFTEAHSMH